MVVIKIGGSRGINLDYVCADVAALVQESKQIVVMHGAGNESNVLGEKLGHPAKHVTSPQGFTSRYTDRETLEIYVMAACGKINTFLVERLQKLGVNAIGLSGVDGRLLEGTRKDAIRIVENGKQRILRDDYTGKVEKVNADLLHALLECAYVPVIAPLAISYQGDAINVDGDRASAMIAGALGAEQLIILTNVPGLLRAFPDEASLITHIDKHRVEASIDFAEGRMKKKVLGASEALGLGVKQVIFADGRVEQPIRKALEGKGTVIE
ncbi:MAG: [LysW]-aminoadipate kinase [Chloroflexi bacterium]|nr:[LysW]-aminoadipate kinase [Chloroflexota bacterium]